MFAQDQETPANDLSGFIAPKYTQNDLMSNRKRLFDTFEAVENETHKKQAPVRSTSYKRQDNPRYVGAEDDNSSPHKARKLGGNASRENIQLDPDLCNFQSFSKNFVTFDNQQLGEDKENKGQQNNRASRKPQKPPQPEQQALPRGTYADRYLLMMKNRRETSTSRQDNAGKSGKKQSMFDDIRSQALAKVHTRHY